MMRTQKRRVTAAIIVLLLETACDANYQTQEEAPAATAAMQETPSFEIMEILARSSNGEVGGTVALSDDVVVTISTVGKKENARLGVKLFSLVNGKLIEEKKMDLNVASPSEHILTFQPVDRWEPGLHLVEVTLDGKLAGHREINIAMAPAWDES